MLITDKYNNERDIRLVKAPVLVLHGAQDAVIPVEMGWRVYRAANEPKRIELFSQGTHDDLFDQGAGLCGFTGRQRRIRSFSWLMSLSTPSDHRRCRALSQPDEGRSRLPPTMAKRLVRLKNQNTDVRLSIASVRRGDVVTKRTTDSA